MSDTGQLVLWFLLILPVGLTTMLIKLMFIHKMDVCYNFLSPMLNKQFLADVHINKIIRNFIICIIKLRSCLTVSNKRIPFIFYLTEVDDLRTVVGILKHRSTYLISLKKISVERSDPKNVKKKKSLIAIKMPVNASYCCTLSHVCMTYW